MTLFYAPAGEAWPEEWLPLGKAESCEFFIADYPSADELPMFDPHEWRASVSFRIESFSARGYWILTRRSHPRVTAAHRAYRRKTRNRW